MIKTIKIPYESKTFDKKIEDFAEKSERQNIKEELFRTEI